MYFRILIKSRSNFKTRAWNKYRRFSCGFTKRKLMKIIRFETNERQITRRVKASKPWRHRVRLSWLKLTYDEFSCDENKGNYTTPLYCSRYYCLKHTKKLTTIIFQWIMQILIYESLYNFIILFHFLWQPLISLLFAHFIFSGRNTC